VAPDFVLPDLNGTPVRLAEYRGKMEEFPDFQCSYCGKFARDTLLQLIKAYVDTGIVRLIYRHYAILGPDSEAAAAACAGTQGPARLSETGGREALDRGKPVRLYPLPS
jgi:protein-disulfide isomerase